MSVTALTLMTECATDLGDSGNDRWEKTDWLDYLNAGERQLVYLKPSSYVITNIFQLVSGVRQTIPTNGIEVVDITRNMGTDGATPGAPIHRTGLKDIDETMPYWFQDLADDVVLNWMFDPNDRKKFVVYPAQPNSGQGYVEALYSAVPTELTDADYFGSNINLADEYTEPLKNFMKFRAMSVDAQNSQNALSRALGYWNLFLTQIGRKDLIEGRLPAERGKRGGANLPV